MKKLLFAVAFVMGLTSCCGGSEQGLALQEGQMWKLSNMEGISAEAVEANADFFTLSFNAEEQAVNGRTNCNTFFGKFVDESGKLSFDEMGMTRMACPNMELEDAFMQMLASVDAYKVENAELSLLSKGAVVATFHVMEAQCEKACEKACEEACDKAEGECEKACEKACDKAEGECTKACEKACEK